MWTVDAFSVKTNFRWLMSCMWFMYLIPVGGISFLSLLIKNISLPLLARIIPICTCNSNSNLLKGFTTCRRTNRKLGKTGFTSCISTLSIDHFLHSKSKKLKPNQLTTKLYFSLHCLETLPVDNTSTIFVF